MDTKTLATEWHQRFNWLARDLYPGRYTEAFCRELAEMAIEVRRLAAEKGSCIVAHNYQYPELQEVADFVGDSLALSFKARDAGARRIDFSSVFFMGATAKMIVGDSAEVYVQDSPEVLGCSLVFGTDTDWIERWKARNPDGALVTYVNSDAYTKSISDYISTSRNTAEIIVRACCEHAGKILVLPDKFLGYVMKHRAVAMGATADRIEVYSHSHGGFNACCYVHEKIGDDAPERALDEYPEAELMIHPECGCASSCLLKLDAGILPRGRVYYLSTEQMIERARVSKAKQFVVATESGMIYRLRKEIPEKEFFPVSQDAVCRYMKANALEKLLSSLRNDRYRLAFDDAANARHESVAGNDILINLAVANRANAAIDRMLETK